MDDLETRSRSGVGGGDEGSSAAASAASSAGVTAITPDSQSAECRDSVPAGEAALRDQLANREAPCRPRHHDPVASWARNSLERTFPVQDAGGDLAPRLRTQLAIAEGEVTQATAPRSQLASLVTNFIDSVVGRVGFMGSGASGNADVDRGLFSGFDSARDSCWRDGGSGCIAGESQAVCEEEYLDDSRHHRIPPHRADVDLSDENASGEKPMSCTVPSSEAQLIDISDGVLHETSCDSTFEDTQPLGPFPSGARQEPGVRISGKACRETSELMNVLPREGEGSRSSSITLLEDIGDSILSCTDTTSSEADGSIEEADLISLGSHSDLNVLTNLFSFYDDCGAEEYPSDAEEESERSSQDSKGRPDTCCGTSGLRNEIEMRSTHETQSLNVTEEYRLEEQSRDSCLSKSTVTFIDDISNSILNYTGRTVSEDDENRLELLKDVDGVELAGTDSERERRYYSDDFSDEYNYQIENSVFQEKEELNVGFSSGLTDENTFSSQEPEKGASDRYRYLSNDSTSRFSYEVKGQRTTASNSGEERIRFSDSINLGREEEISNYRLNNQATESCISVASLNNLGEERRISVAGLNNLGVCGSVFTHTEEIYHANITSYVGKGDINTKEADKFVTKNNQEVTHCITTTSRATEEPVTMDYEQVNEHNFIATHGLDASICTISEESNQLIADVQGTEESKNATSEGTDQQRQPAGQGTGKPCLSTGQVIDQPDLSTGQRTDQPGLSVGQGTDQPEQSTGQEADQQDMSNGQGTDQPYLCTGQRTDQPVPSTGQGTDKPHLPNGQGVDQPDLCTGQGTDQPCLSNGQGTNQPYLSTGQGTDQPDLSTGQRTDQPYMSTGQGTEQPDQSTDQGIDHPHLSTGQGNDQPDLSNDQGLDQPVLSSGQGTNQPELSTDQATDQPDLSTGQGTDKIYMSAGQGTDQLELSTDQGTDQPELSAGQGTDQPKLSIGQETDQLYLSIGQGTEQPELFPDKGTDQPELCTNQGTDQPELSTGQGTDQLYLSVGQRIDKPEPSTDQGTDQPDLSTGQGTNQSEMSTGQGTDQSERSTGQGTEQSEMSSGQGTDQPDLSICQGTDQPDLSTGQVTDQPDLSTGQGIDQPHLSTDQGIDQSDLSTDQGTDQPDLSTNQGTDKPHLSTGQGTDQTNLSTGQETYQPDLFNDRGTDQPHLSTGPGTVQPDMSTGQGKDQPELSTGQGTDQPYMSTGQGRDQPHLSTDLGTDKSHLSTGLGTDQPELSTVQGTDQLSMSIGQGTNQPETFAEQGTNQPDLPTGQGTDQPHLSTGQRTEKPYLSADQGTEQLYLSTGQGTNQHDLFTVKGTDQSSLSDGQGKDQPDLSTAQGIDQLDWSTGQRTNKPNLYTGQETNQPSLYDGQGTDQHDLNTIQGTDQPKLSVGHGTDQYDLSPVQETDEPGLSTVKGTDQPTLSDRLGTDQPDHSIDQGTDQPDLSAGQRIDQNNLSDDQGTDQPDTSVVQGTDQPDLSSDQGANQPSLSISQGTDQPGLSIGQGTDQSDLSTGQGREKPTLSDSHGADQPGLSIRQGTEEPYIGQGTEQPYLYTGQGTDQPDLSTGQRTDQLDLSTSQGTYQPDVHVGQVSDQPSTLGGQETDQFITFISQGTVEDVSVGQGTDQFNTSAGQGADCSIIHAVQGTGEPKLHDGQGTYQPNTSVITVAAVTKCLDPQQTLVMSCIVDPCTSVDVKMENSTDLLDVTEEHSASSHESIHECSASPFTGARETSEETQTSVDHETQQTDVGVVIFSAREREQTVNHFDFKSPGAQGTEDTASARAEQVLCTLKLDDLRASASVIAEESSSAALQKNDLVLDSCCEKLTPRPTGMEGVLEAVVVGLGPPSEENVTCSSAEVFVSASEIEETRCISFDHNLGDHFHNENLTSRASIPLGTAGDCEDGFDAGIHEVRQVTKENTGCFCDDDRDGERGEVTKDEDEGYEADGGSSLYISAGSRPEAEEATFAINLESYDSSRPQEANPIDAKESATCIQDYVEEERWTSSEEVYEGLGESDNVVKSASSRRLELKPGVKSPVSPPLPRSPPQPPSTVEEDFVDALFHACDAQGLGHVSAGLLANHLALTLSELEPRWLLESLRDALCVDGEESRLDLSAYRRLLIGWLQRHAADVSLPWRDPALGPRDAGRPATPARLPPTDGPAPQAPTPIRPSPSGRTRDSLNALGGSPWPPLPSANEDRFRRCLEGHFAASNRRSTLLPWARWTVGCGASEASLVMSRPPSPITSPSSIILNNHENNSNNNNNSFNDANFRGTCEKMNRLGHLTEHSPLNYTFGSIEDEGGITSPDPGDLQQEVLELEHTNRRLTGENVELNTHLTHAEEANVSLREQCHQLEQALSSVQQQLVAARRLEEEMEEVRNQLDSEHEEKERLVDRLAHLEKENVSLTSRLEDLLQKLSSAEEELESQAVLETELVRNHKTEIATLVAQLAKWKMQAEKQAVAAQDLEETIKELKKLIEVLRDEKSSLEDQLAYAKEELISLNTHPETDVSGVDLTEEVALEPDIEHTRDVMLSRSFKKGTFRNPLCSTPFSAMSSTSLSQDMPLSIHSELETMGENRDSLPFCEKVEDVRSITKQNHYEVKEILQQPSFSATGEASLASLLNSMLKWWRDWEESGIPLLKGFMEKDTFALHAHFAAHHDELLRLEKELQDVRRKAMIQTSSATNGRMLMGSTVGESVQTTSQESVMPSSRPLTPKLKLGSHVSQLISKFEYSSRSTSPAYSDHSERLSSVDFKNKLSKSLEMARTRRGSINSYLDNDAYGSSPSYENSRGSSWSDSSRTSPNSIGSIDSPRDSSQMGHKIQEKKKSSDAELCMVEETVDSGPSEEINQKCYSDLVCTKDFMDDSKCTDQRQNNSVHDSNIKQDTGFSDVNTIVLSQEESMTIICDNYEKENKFKDSAEDKEECEGIWLELGLETEALTAKDGDVENMKMENYLEHGTLPECRDKLKNEKSTTVEVDLELETDIYMETSHLMKLMNEVAEQRTTILELRQQLTTAEEEKEFFIIALSRLHNLVLQVSSNTFRWTEGVRKEWLSVVPGGGEEGEGGGGEEDEGAADPLRTLDEPPLTGTHSREEIESLIRARCDLGCPLSGNDLTREYVSPENLAAELERELLALRLHVARSHALLHHYQSSSLHGSRSEVSTPPAAGQHVQGVEAGVECDLCGPTCIPRPCGSAATQTPASPAPATPECEESAATAALWEADEGVSITEDLLQEDGDQRPLTPKHRALRQCVEVKEEEEEEVEEEEEEEGVVREGADMASDHALYAPKPAYDQLDQYRTQSRRKGEEKHRRTGLATITPHGSQVVGSSDNEETEEIKARSIKRTRSLVNILQTCINDPEGAPLSPPPSLDNMEGEEEEEEEEEEEAPHVKEDPLLPSSPESGSSITSADLFCHLTDGTTSCSHDSGVRSLQQPSPSATETNRSPSTPVASDNLVMCPEPPSVTPAASASLMAPANPAAPASPATTIDSEFGVVVRNERSKSCSAVFPSLQDPFLRAAGLSKDDPIPNENLSAQEIEGKFTQLSLAFKTDRLTLRQRLDVQQRQRDTAETNFETEINQLRSSILALHADCVDSELVDAITQVRRHIDILTTSSIRLMSASEVWGAVQQEWRVSRALEVLLLHVENVKRMYERDHQELEEMRRLMNEYQIELPVSPGSIGGTNPSSTDSQAGTKRVRAHSVAGCNNKIQENRRISVSSSTAKTAVSAFIVSRASKRRASLLPDIKPFKELAAVAAAAAAAASASTASTTSKEKTEDNGQPTSGVWASSITEEGSESGEDGNDTVMTSSNVSPNSSLSRALARSHPELYATEETLQDSDRRLSEESNLSSEADVTDVATSSTPTPTPNPRPQHWLMVAVEDIMGWIRGGQWPYSPQETVQGARYAFTSLLLLLAAFFLLLTISYGDSKVSQPLHPGWTTIHHVLHPFVTVQYIGTPPT